MSRFLTFADFNEGQYIKVSGKYFEDRGFLAVEAILQPAKGSIKIESLLRDVDLHARTFRILNQEFALTCLEQIRDLENNSISSESLSAGTLVKLKGKHSAANGFMPQYLKIKETLEFNVEEVEGKIDRVDPENKTIFVNSVPIVFNEKSIIVDSEP